MEVYSDEGDLYSDDDEQSPSFGGGGGGTAADSNRFDRNIPNAADRRAHHNALERKRRDHIKDSFSSLRDSVPSLHGEKASRAQILKKAAEYIQFMKKKNHNVQISIEQIKQQNKELEEQIRMKEQQRTGLSSSSASSTPTPSNPYSSVQSLSLLNSSSESANDVSPSYGDISENSNESSINDLAMVNCGLSMSDRLDSPSPSISSSNGGGSTCGTTIRNGPQFSPQPPLPTTTTTTQPAQFLINGTPATTVRSTVVKNGSSTIIVQNPQQIKTVVASNSSLMSNNGGGGGNGTVGGGHNVIHVTPSTAKNIQINSNNSNITATATPIIISASSLGANTVANNNLNGSTGTIGTNGGALANTYTVLNKGSGALSLTPLSANTNGGGGGGAFRTVVVQQQSNSQIPVQVGTTATPNIHIVSAIPSTYAGRNTKRFKISTTTSAPTVITSDSNNNNNSTIDLTNNTSSSSTTGGTVIAVNQTAAGTNNNNNNTKNNSTAKPHTFNVTSVVSS